MDQEREMGRDKKRERDGGGGAERDRITAAQQDAEQEAYLTFQY